MHDLDVAGPAMKKLIDTQGERTAHLKSPEHLQRLKSSQPFVFVAVPKEGWRK